MGNSSPSATFKIPTARVNLHLGENGRGVGIGKYCSSDSERLEVALDARFEADAKVEFNGNVHFGGSISGRVLGLGSLTRIQSGTTEGGSSYYEDINDYTYPGVYGVYSNEDAANVDNLPVSKAGTLRIYSANGDYGSDNASWVYLIQEYVLYDASAVYRRALQKKVADGVWSYSQWYCYKPT